MNYALVEENLKASYRDVSAQYRRDDEIEVTTENHRRLHRKLADLSASFGHPVSVLDAGCGAGRYFHCLSNARSLVGLDLSPDMLAAARHPVRSETIAVGEIKLVCNSIYRASFPERSFDFIYSLGMFGNGAPVTPEICARFHDWLTPGGLLFFNTVHQSSLDQQLSLRQRLRIKIYPWLPIRLKKILDQRAERLPSFVMTEEQLERIIRTTPFEEFEISKQVCQSPLWKGAHLECVARKQQ